MQRFTSHCEGYPSVSIVIRVKPASTNRVPCKNGQYTPAAPRSTGSKRKAETDLEDIPEEEEEFEENPENSGSEVETDSEDESTIAGPSLSAVIGAYARRVGLLRVPAVVRKDDQKSFEPPNKS